MLIDNLKYKIHNRDACIAVIGLGYVGLPLVIRFSEEGFRVIGFDIDEEKVEKLNKGKSYLKHIPSSSIDVAVNNGFSATSDWERISDCDAILICVPTPLGSHKEPDLQYIRGTMDSIKPHLRVGQLLILESTSYPGTTEEELVPVAEGRGFTVGEDFFVGYSPEREDPGNSEFTIKDIPKVVSGVTDECRSVVKALYGSIVIKTVPVSSTRVAEMTKLLENIHRAVNIGLVNELKMVADKMNIDIFEVINASATKPFGFTPYYPGPGLGGHCIPIDPFYLTWKAKKFGIHTRFIELAGEINRGMPEWVVSKASEALEQHGKSLSGAKVLILGVAYKKNVDDHRETPAFKLMELILERKAEVDYHDPYIPHLTPTRDYDFQMSSVDLSAVKLMEYDLVILVTDHDYLDYDLILQSAKCIVDTRGRFKNADKVVKA
jgi:UDP-N-acetyl-D-glucosamine dehydrogenase